jgi:uncharacterized surface protein with fasciclin (FAS1) repeats
MRDFYKIFRSLSLLTLFICGCNKDEIEAIYGRPKDLAPPIYTQLEKRGNFKTLLALVDKAGYKNILNSSGYWTFFAPNDDAFAKYFSENGISGVNSINEQAAADIVRASTLYNAYRKDNISTFESPERILIPGLSFRKKSTYYDFGYDDALKLGKIVAANGLGTHVLNDNNNKYLPIFTKEFFSTSGVSEEDYKSFYPGTSFIDFNVVDAKVVTADIISENGVAHEIDKVITPMLSLERYLATKQEYAEFKKLLDKTSSYLPHYNLQARYKALTGKDDSVFVKFYSGAAAFSPGSEHFVGGFSSSDAQSDFYSLLVPTNQALLAYKDKLLADWGSDPASGVEKQLSPEMESLLLRSHMYTTALWPSEIATTKNSLAQSSTFTSANIIDRKMLSNGNFYYIDKVQEANEFRTVFSKPFLNSNHQLQTRGLNRAIRSAISDPEQGWGLFMQSDLQFANSGYAFNELNDQYQYTNPATGATIVSDIAKDRFLRILYSSVFDNSYLKLTNLSGQGFLKGSRGESEEPEYIYYKNNEVYGSGNIENGSKVSVTSVVETANGPVFYTSGSLLFAEQSVGAAIKRLAIKYPSVYGKFYEYLSKSPLWTSGDGITGIAGGANYTVLVPTNAAIDAAIAEGKWPAAPNPSSPIEAEKLAANLLYHFVEKRTYAPDGDPEKQGVAITAYKDLEQVDPNTSLVIKSQLGAMQITDKFDRKANLIIANQIEEQLANRAIIHSIDKVLLIR